MTLRKITVANSVKYIPRSEKSQERSRKPKTRKINSIPREQDENFSQNNKKLIKNVAAVGFKHLNGITNCYFLLLNIQIRL